jgi:transposase InsO family protein
VHVAVDDYSRLAYAEVLPDEKATTAIAFLRRALAFFRALRRPRAAGHDRQRLGLPRPQAPLGLPPARTQAPLHRPYRPRTNGKAERFIQTLTNDWARGRLYANSAERSAALDAWLNHYNFRRPHGSLSHRPPATRLTKAPRNYTGPAGRPRRSRAH